MSYPFELSGVHVPSYNLQPLSSPSEHSLFSVQSRSSSSSSVVSHTDKSSLAVNLHFGKKIRKALSRSNSVHNEFETVSYKDRKKFISNPMPITEIPVRQGSVDLRHMSFQQQGSLEQSLKNNTNYYFHHDKSQPVPEEKVSHSYESIQEEKEEEKDKDFYFTSGSESRNSSPFDGISHENKPNVKREMSKHSRRPSTSIINQRNEGVGRNYYGEINDFMNSPVQPLRLKRNNFGTTIYDDKRVSAASTMTTSGADMGRQTPTYRSSRVTLNRLKIKTTAVGSADGDLKSPEFSLFSPTKQDFGNNTVFQHSLNKLNNNYMPRMSGYYTTASNMKEKSTFTKVTAKQVNGDNDQFDTEDSYEACGVYRANLIATSLLKQARQKSFFENTRTFSSWI